MFDVGATSGSTPSLRPRLPVEMDAPVAEFSSLRIDDRAKDNARGPQGQHIPPIHRLPAEIVIQILYMVVRTQKNPVPALLGLACICKRWISTVNETPGLWSIVSTEDTSAHIQQALRNSGQHPLAARVEHTWSTQKFGTSWTDDLALIQAHSHRWRTLDVNIIIPHIYIGRPPLFTGDTPMLERLSIRSGSESLGRLSRVPVGLFPTQADKLQYLALKAVDAPLRSPILTNLRTLKIENSRNKLSFDDIWIILGTNRTLETFVLRTDGLIHHPGTHPYAGTSPIIQRDIVELPHLCRLSLLKLRLSFVHELLSHIHAPSLETFRMSTLVLELGEGRRETTPLLKELMNILPPRLQNPSDEVKLKVTIRHHDIEIAASIGEERPAFQVQFTPLTFIQFLNWVKNTLAPKLGNPGISLFLEPSDEIALDILTDFGPNLTTLEVKPRRFVVNLIQVLGDPGSSGGWRFPNLESLSLGASVPLEAILMMLQRRYWRMGGDMRSRPQPLNRFSVRLPGKKTSEEAGYCMAAIRDIIGPAFVITFSE